MLKNTQIHTGCWPIYENPTSTHIIGYIVSTDDIPGLPYPRLGEVYRTGGRWASSPMGGDGVATRLGFRTRRDAIAHLVTVAQDRSNAA